MPENAHTDMPNDIPTRLPQEAQEIYEQAFEDAWKRYGRSPRDESRAHAVAWAAVKKQYHQNERGEWEAGAPEGDARHPKHLDDRRIF